MITHKIMNRDGTRIIHSAEIYCEESSSVRYKNSLAFFSARKEGVNIRYSNLSYSDLSNSDLSNSELRNSDLSKSNLSNSNLSNSNLSYSDLSKSNLSYSDLSKSILLKTILPYQDITPIIPNIHKALLNVVNIDGNLLNMEDWHICNTTHCIAGWIVTLACNEGIILEKKVGTNVAASLIYMKSDPDLKRIPDYFASKEKAMQGIIDRAA